MSTHSSHSLAGERERGGVAAYSVRTHSLTSYSYTSPKSEGSYQQSQAHKILSIRIKLAKLSFILKMSV